MKGVQCLLGPDVYCAGKNGFEVWELGLSLPCDGSQVILLLPSGLVQLSQL
jgi:hypothetical protein